MLCYGRKIFLQNNINDEYNNHIHENNKCSNDEYNNHIHENNKCINDEYNNRNNENNKYINDENNHNNENTNILMMKTIIIMKIQTY